MTIASFNLYDMLTSAQGQAAIAGLAQQFNLSHEQASKAMEALAPAFSLSPAFFSAPAPPPPPDPLTQLARNMGTEPYLRAMGALPPEPAAAPASAAQAGAELVGAILRSPEVSKAVVNYAAAHSGVAGPVIQQMLPMLAALLIGSAFTQAQAQAQPQAPNQMLTQLLAMFAPKPAAPTPPPPAPAPPQAANPMAELIAGMFNAFAVPEAAAPAPMPAPEPEPAKQDVAGSAMDMLGQMFAAGRAAQAAHTQAMQDILATSQDSKPADQA